MKEPQLTTSEVARVLRVAENTVRGLERRGELTATRTGTRIRLFTKSDVDRLARERAKGGR